MNKASIEAVRESMEQGKPTMVDVAKLAGVSAMTVSRVMNGKSLVRESTRRKVAEAVAALNYTPNQEARNLAGSKPIRVGFLYSNPSAAYLSEFLVGLLNQSGLNNVQLFVEKCEAGNHEIEHTQRLINNGLDGVILPPPLCDSVAVLECVERAGIPAVVVACGSPAPGVGSVSIDDYDAAHYMARHLIALGHQRIGFVVGHPNQTASARRLDGSARRSPRRAPTPPKSWWCRACSPTARAWMRPSSCWRWPTGRPRSSPATTTWPRPRWRSRTASAWTCRAT